MAIGPMLVPLDAVDTLTIKLQFGRYNWVVEADITGFFDNIDHEWLIRMLAERIDDRALLRLIKKWLKAGVLDTDGTGEASGDGNPARGSGLTHPRQCVLALCTRSVV